MIRFVGWLVIAVIPLIAIEVGSFLFVQERDSWFSHRDQVLERLSAEAGRYDRFLRETYHPVYGWDRRGPATIGMSDCLGREVQATINPDRSRVMPEVDTGPEVLLVGDSFTEGAEVNDDETFAWHLAGLLERPVRNHGVGGFGPVQAVLKFEEIAAAYPDVAVVVLGIMHENVRRMLTRYRPLLSAKTSVLFGFQPYMAEGAVQPNPNGPQPRPFNELPELATTAFAEDFLALPEPTFPYSLQVVRLLASQQFWLPIDDDEHGTLAHYYESPAIRAELEALLERFVEQAQSRGIEPVVLFLPRNRFDRVAPEPAIAALERHFGDRLTVIAFGRTEMDWTTYLIGNDDCHPSPAGQEAIARTLSPILRPMLDAAGLEAGETLLSNDAGG